MESESVDREIGRFTNEDLRDRLDDLDCWIRDSDNAFARSFIDNHLSELDALFHRTPTKCCACCNSMLSGRETNVNDLHAVEKNCHICALILRTVKRYSASGTDASVKKVDGALAINPGGRHILRLYSGLESSEENDAETKIGLPVLSAAKNPLRFALLRAWLQWCDKKHDCTRNDKTEITLPTRLISVGNPDNPGYNPHNVCLVEGKGIRERYIALSHCWGTLDPKRDFRTTKKNLPEREEALSIASLPRTFQDAIEVTRELGIPYLWIDSLCIVQGDGGDWGTEAEKMETVFRNAYCTIAATSAVNAYAGFLARSTRGESIYVQDNSGRRVYVCADIADFDEEVEQATLNDRAWVMQERFLSRRTIHFGAKQAYWECGTGVHCEDLTTSQKSEDMFFRLDANFPHRLYTSGFGVTLEFVQSFLGDYSKRGITENTDRAIALSGLEAHIAKALSCKKSYGIFELYLHRTLLWHWSGGPMELIKYEKRKVPSWSWMAYNGSIEFVDIEKIPYGQLDVFDNVRLEGENTLITTVWGIHEECTPKQEAAGHVILYDGTKEIGWIKYDVEEDRDLCSERGVVLGKYEDKYYMIVTESLGENEYKRVGYGEVQKDYVSPQTRGVRLL